MTEPKEQLKMSQESLLKYTYLYGKVDAVQYIRAEAKKVFDDPYNFIVKQDALEKVRAEIEQNRDEWIKGQDAEWHTYNRCLGIIDKYTKGEQE